MKTWLITGCSSGIGKGIAKAVLENGDQAVITARDEGKLAELAAQYPDTCLPVSLEIRDRKSVDEAVKKAVERFGSIDMLVNNAGHGYRSAVEEGEDAGIADVFETNFFGPVYLINRVLPMMREKRSGAIVNVTSIAGVRSAVGSGYYAASKSSLEMVSEALYQEVSPLGIKVMIVEPGAFRTKFYDEALKGTTKPIADYAETAGKRHVENEKNNRDQLGNPDKGGRVIVDTIEQDVYPKRLPLGSDAARLVEKVLTDRLAEVQAWKEVSGRSDFD